MVSRVDSRARCENYLFELVVTKYARINLLLETLFGIVRCFRCCHHFRLDCDTFLWLLTKQLDYLLLANTIS